MTALLLKTLLSAVLIVAISELSRRSSFWGALLASLPLTSLLALVWMHLDGAGSERVATTTLDIFWLVLPSLVFFLLLPALLRAGAAFWPSLLLSCAATAGAYGLMGLFLHRAGS